MSKSKGSPRKFSEKIALLNKKEAEANAEFEKIIKEVEETTRAPVTNQYPSRASSSSSWIDTRPPIVEVQQQPILSNNFNHYMNQQHNGSTYQHHHYNSPGQLDQSASVPVPDIEIFAIDDDDSRNQHHVTTNYDFERVNSITTARSLPDIANLRVSGDYAAAGAAYSNQRVPSNFNYDYDANSNIVTESSAHSYCPQVNDLPQQAGNWQTATFNQQDPRPQPVHHNCYHQTQPGSIIRASSTNAVLTSWHDSDTLNAPRLNSGYLSKSTEGCYGYLEAYSSDDHFSSTLTNQIDMNPPVVVGNCSNYSNIENVDFQDDSKQNSSQY